MMKWLLLFLLSVNAVIFIVQIKGMGGAAESNEYIKVPAAKDVKLLNELGVAEDVRGRCIVIGELDNELALKGLSDFLNTRNVKYELIEKKEELAPSYWVFAQDDANKDLQEDLNALGVESYLVAEGDWMGKVSLGLFANIDLAEDLMKDLKDEGVMTMFVEKKKYKNTKWISFRLDEVARSGRLLDELNALKINVGQIKEFFCKSIASEK